MSSWRLRSCLEAPVVRIILLIMAAFVILTVVRILLGLRKR